MGQRRKFILYHRTTPEEARAVLSRGFRDSSGTHEGRTTWRGVWLSASPAAAAEHAPGEAVIEVRVAVSERELGKWEWTGEGRVVREWLIPAGVLNPRMTARLLEQKALSEAVA